MRSISCAAVAAILLSFLPGCASTPAQPHATPVLLVSLDGLGAAQYDPALAPNLARMAAGGVRAEWMTPSYPTLTFPNHTTLVTGLRPDHHGVVHNTMEDAALGGFSTRTSGDSDPGWWEGGTPVWVSAERAGLRTATYFWPGSDSEIHGVRPGHWFAYAEDVALADQVDTVLGWLGAPPDTRPHFVTLYFPTVDHAAHWRGPDSPEARDAIREVDAAMGRLLDGLARHGLRDRVDIVVVSDHGMAPVPMAQVVATEAMVDPADARVVASGQSVGFVPLPGRTAAAEARLLGAHAQYDCWRKADLPTRWHYGTHPRVPPIVCQMHEGWDAEEPARFERRPTDGMRGSHGYDPLLPSMRAVFIADGPSFREGAVLPPLENVDVYPLLMHLLGLPPAPHDGDGDALEALRQ